MIYWFPSDTNSRLHQILPNDYQILIYLPEDLPYDLVDYLLDDLPDDLLDFTTMLIHADFFNSCRQLFPLALIPADTNSCQMIYQKIYRMIYQMIYRIILQDNLPDDLPNDLPTDLTRDLLNDLPNDLCNFFSQQVAIIHGRKFCWKKFQVYFIQYKIITWQQSL